MTREVTTRPGGVGRMVKKSLVLTAAVAALAVPATSLAQTPTLTVNRAEAGLLGGSSLEPWNTPGGWPSLNIFYTITGDPVPGFFPGTLSLTETVDLACINKNGKPARPFSVTQAFDGSTLFWNEAIPQLSIGVSVTGNDLFIDTSSLTCPKTQTLELKMITFSTIVLAFPTVGLSATIDPVVYVAGTIIAL